MRRNREKLFNKRGGGAKTPKIEKAKSPKAKGKKVRLWKVVKMWEKIWKLVKMLKKKNEN